MKKRKTFSEIVSLIEIQNPSLLAVLNLNKSLLDHTELTYSVSMVSFLWITCEKYYDNEPKSYVGVNTLNEKDYTLSLVLEENKQETTTKLEGTEKILKDYLTKLKEKSVTSDFT